MERSSLTASTQPAESMHNYLRHWGLTHSPFRTQTDVARAYVSGSIDEALARVEYLVQEQRRLGVLVGDRGVGKSVLLAMIARDFRRRGADVALIDGAGVSTREMLWQMAVQLGAGPQEAIDTSRLWRKIADHLAQNRWQQRPTLLLIDDAGALGPDQQTHLVRLARLEPQGEARWTMLLVIDPGQLAKMDASLLHIIDMKIEIENWEAEDTEGFVQHALVDAGRYTPIFTDEALTELHRLAGGSPRHVARLADFALLAAAGVGALEIDAPTVQAAFDEIAWSPTPRIEAGPTFGFGRV